MRQLTYVAPGKVEWEEILEPRLVDPAGVLVRPLAAARCDLDLPMVMAGTFPGPFPVGHEFVGEIVAIGEEVAERQVGERVLVPFQVSCGVCVACRGGRFGACHHYRAPAGAAFGFGPAGGGHGGAVADVIAVPSADHLLLPTPERIPSTTLCTLTDNLVDAYRTVGPQLQENPGAEVLIVGSKAVSVGLYSVMVAVGLGASRVRYVDSDAGRCAVDRAPITVDNTGDADGLVCTLRSTDDYGICTHTKGVTFHVSRADSRRYLPTVLDLVEQQVIDPLSVPTTIVDWDQADQSWLEPAVKLVLER